MRTQATAIRRSTHFLAAAVFAAATLGATSAFATPITIQLGNAGGNGTTDNVLFNDGSLLHSGLLVQGNFSGSGNGYILDFTSASGSGLLAGSGGQATLTGGLNNNPFDNVTFKLEGGATFTNAILNIDSDSDGQVQFIVKYINGAGSPFTQAYDVDANGQNFFHVDATSPVAIQSITINGLGDVDFTNISQFRIGGFAPADVVIDPHLAAVPEPGSLILLGSGVVGALAFRRRLKR